MKQRIIINADDFGKNSQVNSAIEKCMIEHTISSSTIMANGDAFEEAIEIARLHPEISFGAHLCIDELQPITKSQILLQNGLVGENGCFVKGWYKEVPFDKELLAAIFDEWSAQIEKIRNAGISISHLDSHHHCHVFAQLPSILVQLKKKYEIQRVRLNNYRPLSINLRETKSKNPVLNCNNNSSTETSNRLLRLFKGGNNWLHRYRTFKYLRNNFNTTDFFCSVAYYNKNSALLSRFETIELMCHPGHVAYSEETKLLDNILLDDAKLITYCQI